MRGDKELGGQRIDIVERVEVCLHIVKIGYFVFFERGFTRNAVSEEHDIVRRAVADHVENVSMQGNDLNFCGKIRGSDVMALGFLRHQKLVSERLAGRTAVQQGRLQNGVICDAGFNARGENFAAGVLLKISVASGVVGVGVRVEYGLHLPALGL